MEEARRDVELLSELHLTAPGFFLQNHNFAPLCYAVAP